MQAFTDAEHLVVGSINYVSAAKNTLLELDAWRLEHNSTIRQWQQKKQKEAQDQYDLCDRSDSSSEVQEVQMVPLHFFPPVLHCLDTFVAIFIVGGAFLQPGWRGTG